MHEFSFEIQVEEFDPAILDDLDAFGSLALKLANVGNADLGLTLQAGAVMVDVWRDDCPTEKKAIIKTIQEIGTLGLIPIRITPDDLVSAAELAERLGRTPASIVQLVKGLRGAGNFPAPVAMHGRKSPLFSYLKVISWSISTGTKLIKDEEGELRRAKTRKTANDALGLLAAAVIAENKIQELISD